jgi:hypothetical protein
MSENNTENKEVAVEAKFEPQVFLKEMQDIRNELRAIKTSPLLKTYESISNALFLQFIKGIFFGFGSFLGATIVVSIVVYLLSNIEFVPIIGEWVKSILAEIQK